jgi:hypothetical protein
MPRKWPCFTGVRCQLFAISTLWNEDTFVATIDYVLPDEESLLALRIHRVYAVLENILDFKDIKYIALPGSLADTYEF